MTRLILLFAAVLGAAPPAIGEPIPEPLQRVRFDQNLDAPVRPELRFTDEAGRSVRLGEYFGDRPVILVLAYYECPMLCTMVINGMVQGLQEIPFAAGEDYEWVVVSIDPAETPDLARKKKNTYAARYAHGGAEEGWHFLVGDAPRVNELAETVGFRFAYDERTEQYAHPAGAVLLTGEGRVSHYFFGTEFDSRDLRLGLVEASEGEIGSPTDTLLLRCYHYDPETGRYGFAVMSAVRAAGGLTLIGLTGLIGGLLWRDRLRKRRAEA